MSDENQNNNYIEELPDKEPKFSGKLNMIRKAKVIIDQAMGVRKDVLVRKGINNWSLDTLHNRLNVALFWLSSNDFEPNLFRDNSPYKQVDYYKFRELVKLRKVEEGIVIGFKTIVESKKLASFLDDEENQEDINEILAERDRAYKAKLAELEKEEPEVIDKIEKPKRIDLQSTPSEVLFNRAKAALEIYLQDENNNEFLSIDPVSLGGKPENAEEFSDMLKAHLDKLDIVYVHEPETQLFRIAK